jgi:PBP1b-binding outer membrane lipoprotein LpoB
MKHYQHLFLIGLLSCGAPEIRRDQQGVSTIEQIDIADFQQAAGEHVNAMIAQGIFDDNYLTRDSRGRVILAFDKIENNATTRIDTRNLTSFVISEMQKTKKVVATRAFSFDEANMSLTSVREVRDIEQSDPYAASKEERVERGLVTPDVVLTGRIYNERREYDGSKSNQMIMELIVVSVQDGTEIYREPVVVTKRTN